MYTLPEDWSVTNPRKKQITKRELLQHVDEEMKEGESILDFELAILKKYIPVGRTVTQYDTMLTSMLMPGKQAMKDGYIETRMWRKSVKNFIFKQVLTTPLENPITIFCFYDDIRKHFTTLVYGIEEIYFYDSLATKTYVVPKAVEKVYKAVRHWYEDNEVEMPVIIQNEKLPKINKVVIPQQNLGDLCCSMHMLLVSLATIYQGDVPEVYWTTEHAFFFRGELLPCVEEIVKTLCTTK